MGEIYTPLLNLETLAKAMNAPKTPPPEPRPGQPRDEKLAPNLETFYENIGAIATL